ncbi:MAG: SPOR domain-containing protein, partial [bacterium]
MRKLHYLFVVTALVCLTGCQKKAEKAVEKEVEKFAENKPLAMEVTRVRSYYHAQNIKDRLQNMGLIPYVVASQDTVAGGKWYAILVGAVKDSLELNKLNGDLKAQFKFDSLKVVDYTAVKNNLVEIVAEDARQKEKKQIEAEKPGIPDKFYGVITKFPKSNMFFVQKLHVFGAPEKNEEKKMFSLVKDAELDLPRGISQNLLLDLTLCFAEAVYRDNIYGDRVTMDVVKLKPDHGIAKKVTKAAFPVLPGNREDQLTIAGYFADLVLNTGEYLTEEKTEFSVPAFNHLVGYRTVIQPKA